MAIKMRTRSLMIVIGLLCVLMALPFQCRTEQGELYRRRADRHDALASDFRAAERRARAKGDLAAAKQHRLQAERIEQQGWVYRQASYRHWKWPELRPPWRGRRSP